MHRLIEPKAALVALLALWQVFCGIPGSAQNLDLQLPGEAAAQSEAEIAAGWQLQQSVAQSNQPDVITAKLLAAIQHYERAIQLTPYAFPPHLLGGVAYARLAEIQSKRDQAIAMMQTALVWFERAAGTDGRDEQLFRYWLVLLKQMQPLLPSADFLGWLQRHERALRAGLEGGTSSIPAVFYQVHLGGCLALQGLVSNSAQGGPLLEEAVALLSKAEVSSTVDAETAVNELAAVVMYKVGASKGDRVLVEASVKRFYDLIFHNPQTFEHRYNLACALANLGQFDEALVQLEIIFASAKGEWFFKSAQADPDLASLRARQGYRDMVAQYSGEQVQRELEDIMVEANRHIVESQHAAETAVVLEALKKSQALIQKALEIQPDLYQARLLEAETAQQTAEVIKDPVERAKWLRRARQSYEMAADSPGADTNVFQKWAWLLIIQIDQFAADRPERLALLQEVVKICERGLQVARYKSESARLHLFWGHALALQAEAASEPAAQRQLFREAVARFRSADRIERVAKDQDLYLSWGVALLKLGKSTHDKLLIRQGAERLQTILELNKNNYNAHYNSACAHALLKEVDEAVRHLAVCFRGPQAGRFRQAALTDTDFDEIRHTDAYKALVGGQSPLDEVNKPRL